MKQKLLWLSYQAPYDTVDHAGGKVHNFYVKSFQKSDNFDIRLVSFCYTNEVVKLDLSSYHISNRIYILATGGIKWFLRNLLEAEVIFSPFNRYAGTLPNYQAWCAMKTVREYKKHDYQPDLIFLQWTQMVLLTPLIKKYFPQSKIIAIEEDVTFLSFERKAELAKGFWGKFTARHKLKKIKKLELEALKQSDLVVLNNEKDYKLVVDNGIDKDHIYQTVSYFTNYSHSKRVKPTGKNIIFFGSMIRQENHLSALWFIEKVLPLIEDPQVTFTVIGSSPRKELLALAGDRVKVLGFVEDVSPYFASGLCMAAPLVLGAGVKIKIMEGLSAGIPVLTNQIGIEGIPAKDGEEYIHCETPKDYVQAIEGLLSGRIDAEKMSEKAKAFINRNYSPKARIDGWMERVKTL